MYNLNIKTILVLIIIVILNGCASKPEDIKIQYVSPLTYKDYDCEQILAEKNRIDNEIHILYQSLKKRHDSDTGTAIGSLFFWPMLFVIDGDGPEVVEYGRLRGQAKALQEMSIRKKCGLDFSKYQFKKDKTQ